jgi:hypothetical protein
MKKHQKKALIELLLLWAVCIAAIVVIIAVARYCEAQEISGVDNAQIGRLYKYKLEGEKEITQPKILVFGIDVDCEIVGDNAMIVPREKGIINIIACGLHGEELFLINKPVTVGDKPQPTPQPPTPQPAPEEKTLAETLKDASASGVEKVESKYKDREKKAVMNAIESVISKYASADLNDKKNQAAVRESLRMTIQRNLNNVSSDSVKTWQVWDEAVKEVLTGDKRTDAAKILDYYEAVKQGLN